MRILVAVSIPEELKDRLAEVTARYTPSPRSREPITEDTIICAALERYLSDYERRFPKRTKQPARSEQCTS